MALAPMAVAVLGWHSVAVTAAASVFFALAFVAFYVAGIRWARRARRRFVGGAARGRAAKPQMPAAK